MSLLIRGYWDVGKGIKIPACASINGKLDFPLLQPLRLSTASPNIARPGATPKVRLTGLLQNRNPTRPMENNNPPEIGKL